MRNLSRSEAVGLIALLTIITGIVGWSAVRVGFGAASSSGVTLRDTFPQAPAAPPPVRPPTDAPKPVADFAPQPLPDATEIVVHVVGAVKKPGVYHLRPGARYEDALKAAGGATSAADANAVNLAAKVEDGSRLVIPTRAEVKSGAIPPDPVAPSSESAPAASSRSSAVKTHAHHAGGHSDKLTDPKQGQINLNAASAEQLQRIPGVGPAMAARILEFRKESGGFKSAEDLLQISGIGEKKFAKMKCYVTVGPVVEVGHKQR